ncbi:gliding motility-associated C-terminal domain-containing protein [Paracrocinitomix mangrovi]|uniref:T9SS type B sorting domain-containing protein n=1 Tax=Paracrocinitomix mangrovi TaxID=2862509 RepID=UPI001C8F0CE4|nr:gliding motility-associated C-terminal domain-containing protein [Paracrocinitomix mangrovi]UKN01686.1 gliding motility-associated C-terminal domain-containing protein [Paracrocinitomix mangrovi]
MKNIVLAILSISIITIGYSQTPNNCGNFTSTGSSSASGYADPNAACGANVPGTITGGAAAWTGTSCSGTIVSTVTGPPVNCLVVSYGAVNTDDYGTISTDSGGPLTLSVVNAGVNGNVIGPFNCGSGYYGNVMVTVCSSTPFSQVILTNTGCSSGWVINCADQGTCSNSVTAGADNFSTVMCGGTIDLDNLVTGDAGGTWTETTIPASGAFNTSTGVFNANGLQNGTYTFQYEVTGGCAGSDIAQFSVTVDCQCLITNMTANIGACSGGTYSTTGLIQFANPPSTGQLIVEDCFGNQDVFNAPFGTSVNYTITGQNPNGAPCDITAYFTADMLCAQTINYTAPTCPCFINNFTANIGLCQSVDNTYGLDGIVEFTNPPSSGTLVIQVDNGTTIYDTIINAPFTSPQSWSISGIPSDAAASSVTAYFVLNPSCTSTINYTAPGSCACYADIGTFTATMTGSSSNNYVLCYGDQINITSNGDWVGPGEMFNPPGPVYNPGVSWLMYSCPPTVATVPDPNDNVPDDPCFIGLISNTNMSDINDLAWINSFPPGTFTDNIIYWVPLTFYDQSGGTYSFVNGNSLPCYEMGAPYAVQYLPDFTSSFTEDCLAGTATITVGGALPAIDGSNFTATNLQPSTASFANNTATDGGTITINGLQGGDMWSFDITDANGCPYTVTGGPFPPLEDPGFNYPQSSWCTSEAATMPNITGVPGGTFTSTPAGLSINAGSGQITPSTSTPGTYDITYTTPGACFDDSTLTITIASTPTVDPIADQTVCNGDNFTGITFTGSAGTTFNWVNNNTNIGLGASGTGNIATFAGTAGIVQEVANITVTPVAGACTGTAESFFLTVNPTEDPGFSYSAPDYCADAAVQSPNITGTTGGTFSVTPAGLSINTATGDITPSTSTPGTYDVTYTTPGPCTETSTVSVTINPVPDVNPIADQTVCVGSNFTAVNFTGSVAGTTFDWTNTNTAIGLAASGNGNIAAFTGQTNGGNITGTVTVTPSTSSCTGTAETFNLTVNDLDDASFEYSPGLTYCQTAADPVINITGLQNGNFTYIVASGGPTLDLDANTGAVALATSDIGAYNITYGTVGATGSLCPNTFTLQLVITPAPVADFTLGDYCANVADPLPTYINGGSGGTFSSTAGLIINANTGMVDLSASTPGTYIVTNEINVPGCALASATDDITIYGLPDATISGTTDICDGDPLPNITINATAGSPLWDFTYNFNGTPTTITGSSATNVITSAAVGTYDLVSITDGNGCTNPITGQAVIGLFPTPNVDPIGNQTVCEGDDLLVNTFSSDIPGSTFSWTVTNGVDAGFGTSGTGDIGTFTGANTTTSPLLAIIDVVATSPDGCVGPPQTFTITVNPLPNPSFTADTLYGCEPLAVQFTNTTDINSSNCVWTFSNGISLNGCGSVYYSFPSGVFDVTLSTVSTAGCASEVTYSNLITVVPTPTALFTYSPQETNVLDPVIDFNNNSIDAYSYTWNFGDDSGYSFEENPTHEYPEVPEEYMVTLIAYDENGWCPDTMRQIVTIDDILIFYVPNIFTPDGDEFNQNFKPIFYSGYDKFNYHLTIFNRWGEIIFESYNADYGWNGHYGDGGLVQDGVYVWQIEFKETMSDKEYVKRGHVTVLK